MIIFAVNLVFEFHLYSWAKHKLINVCYVLGEQGMVDEAQKALEEAEALKKVFNIMFFLKFWECFLINQNMYIN